LQFDGNVNAPTISPSVLINGLRGGPPSRPRCHCYVRAGRIEFLSDSTHALADHTVEMPGLAAWLRDAGD
jgi:hypothetical protein